MDSAAIRDVFAAHDLRWTRQREEVYAALAASHTHPTAEELFRLVQPGEADSAHGGMSLATVYNTLEALVRSGLARRMSTACAPGGGGTFRYDADLDDHAHVVGADGRIHDLPDDLALRVVEAIPPALVADIEQRLGLRIDRLSVEFVEAVPADPSRVP